MRRKRKKIEVYQNPAKASPVVVHPKVPHQSISARRKKRKSKRKIKKLKSKPPKKTHLLLLTFPTILTQFQQLCQVSKV